MWIKERTTRIKKEKENRDEKGKEKEKKEIELEKKRKWILRRRENEEGKKNSEKGRNW